jgi:hypothetical protein
MLEVVDLIPTGFKILFQRKCEDWRHKKEKQVAQIFYFFILFFNIKFLINFFSINVKLIFII